MKRTLFSFAAAIMLGMAAMPTMAQTESFNDQTQFITPKGTNSVNIRTAPNAKAKKIFSLAQDETLPVLSEQNGWYQVLLTDGKKGWISKSVCRISNTPLDVKKICDHVFGISETYEDWCMWTVAQVKGTDMFVAITTGSNMLSPMDMNALWLGKKVGNTLVFDEYVPFTSSYDAVKSSRFDIYPLDNYEDGYVLFYGDNFAMPDNQGGLQFRPSLLTQDTIKKIFNGKQKRDWNLFLGPQMFGKKYAEVVIG